VNGEGGPEGQLSPRVQALANRIPRVAVHECTSGSEQECQHAPPRRTTLEFCHNQGPDVKEKESHTYAPSFLPRDFALSRAQSLILDDAFRRISSVTLVERAWVSTGCPRASRMASMRRGGCRLAVETSRSVCEQCRSRSTCALVVGGDSHATFLQLGGHEPSRSRPLPEKSVFRRTLPSELVAFSSPAGRGMFREAMQNGHMEPYFPLIEQFVTQDEPTFCGLGTLTMVMNALRVDPRRRWRDEGGPGWRWWSDDMFPTSCTSSLAQVREVGTTMEEFRLMAEANGARVRMRRPTDPGESLETFRESIVEASLASSDAFTVTSFCRASLGQTGAHLDAIRPLTPPGPPPAPRWLTRADGCCWRAQAPGTSRL
jgi:hypothetical protein